MATSHQPDVADSVNHCRLEYYNIMSVDYSDSRWDALRTLYYDSATTGSAQQLKRRLGTQYTLKQIEAFIKNQATSQRFHDRKRPTTFFPLSIGPTTQARPWYRVQVDLLDTSNLGPANRNQGRNFVYVAIDVFSRYGVAIPLRSKADQDCRSALTRLAATVERLPGHRKIDYLVSDNEASFSGQLYRDECKSLDIVPQYVPANDPSRHRSLAFVDRWCRTLRTNLEQAMDRNGNRQWSSELAAVVQNYNTTVHRFTNRTPEQMLTEAVQPNVLRLEVARRHQSNKAAKQKWARADIQVGSHVRYRLPTTVFSKKTKARFSDGVYTVRRVIDHCFYLLSFGPDDSPETAGIDNDTKFRKDELLLVDRPPSSKPAEASEDDMEQKYDSEGDADEERARRRLAREGLD